MAKVDKGPEYCVELYARLVARKASGDFPRFKYRTLVGQELFEFVQKKSEKRSNEVAVRIVSQVERVDNDHGLIF